MKKEVGASRLKYVSGANLEFVTNRKGERVAVAHGYMGCFDTVQEAAQHRKDELHPSFMPYIYEVDLGKVHKNVMKTTGMGRYRDDCPEVTRRCGAYGDILKGTGVDAEKVYAGMAV